MGISGVGSFHWESPSWRWWCHSPKSFGDERLHLHVPFHWISLHHVDEARLKLEFMIDYWSSANVIDVCSREFQQRLLSHGFRTWCKASLVDLTQIIEVWRITIKPVNTLKIR
jgi:hypothetical protein